MKKFNEGSLAICINKQMEINWYKERLKDLRLIDNWFNSFTTTKEKEEEFISFLKDYFLWYIPKKTIDKEVWMFILNYWLRVKK